MPPRPHAHPQNYYAVVCANGVEVGCAVHKFRGGAAGAFSGVATTGTVLGSSTATHTVSGTVIAWNKLSVSYLAGVITVSMNNTVVITCADASTANETAVPVPGPTPAVPWRSGNVGLLAIGSRQVNYDYIEVVEAPSCNDTINNGLESGIDCGGPVCASCPGVVTFSENFNGITGGSTTAGMHRETWAPTTGFAWFVARCAPCATRRWRRPHSLPRPLSTTSRVQVED